MTKARATAGEKLGKKTTARCTICGNPSQHRYRPFCSRRCADIDLSRWLHGAYAIPGEAANEDGEEPPSGADSTGG
jgi:endogenous inhibitor of DNA gyrase (YacG/DUF329 family)